MKSVRRRPAAGAAPLLTRSVLPALGRAARFAERRRRARRPCARRTGCRRAWRAR